MKLGSFTLHLDGECHELRNVAVAMPIMERPAVPARIEATFDFAVEFTPEQRRTLLVFWLIASALAKAGRILD